MVGPPRQPNLGCAHQATVLLPPGNPGRGLQRPDQWVIKQSYCLISCISFDAEMALAIQNNAVIFTHEHATAKEPPKCYKTRDIRSLILLTCDCTGFSYPHNRNTALLCCRNNVLLSQVVLSRHISIMI